MTAGPGAASAFPAPALTVSRAFGGSREAGQRLMLHDPFLQRLTRTCTLLPVCAEDLAALDATALVDGVLAHRRSDPPLATARCCVEDYQGLRDETRRHTFLTLLFALARLRAVRASGSRAQLVEFHTRYKYLLMAYGAHHVTTLGRIVADVAGQGWDMALAAYRAGLIRALETPAAAPATANALAHVFGYISDRLEAGERAFFLSQLDALRAGDVQPVEVIELLQGWVLRFDEAYLRSQALFMPWPAELHDG